jgi:hypothetical protein
LQSRPITAEWRLAALLVALFALFVFLVAGRHIEWGASQGRWIYPVVADATWRVMAVALVVSIGAVLILEAAGTLVAKRDRLAIAVLIAAGFGLHIAERIVHPTTLAAIVRSDVCNSFYSVALTYRPAELLSRFGALAPTLPLHATTNMPGKSIIFHVLGLVSEDPAVLGVLIVACSDAIGILVYLLVRRWFASRQVALVAVALYMAFPARTVFFPLLNVLSPFFILLALLTWLLFLDSRRTAWLWMMGVCLYGVMFTDPLALALGIVFIGVLLQRMRADAFESRELAQALFVPVCGFAAVHLAVRLASGFDVIGAFRMLAANLVEFNERSARPYGVWAVKNLTEFVLSSGFLTSTVVLAGVGTAVFPAIDAARRGASGALREVVARPGPNLLLFLTLNVLALNLTGLNRGEVTRLWIFMSVPVQIAAAWLCVERYGRACTRVVVAAATFQSVLMLNTVGFLIC